MQSRRIAALVSLSSALLGACGDPAPGAPSAAGEVEEAMQGGNIMTSSDIARLGLYWISGCSASVLASSRATNETWFVTAGHCVVEGQCADLYNAAGARVLPMCGTVHVHPQFVQSNALHDLALVRYPTYFTMPILAGGTTTEFRRPILASKPPADSVMIFGMGYQASDGCHASSRDGTSRYGWATTSFNVNTLQTQTLAPAGTALMSGDSGGPWLALITGNSGSLNNYLDGGALAGVTTGGGCVTGGTQSIANNYTWEPSNLAFLTSHLGSLARLYFTTATASKSGTIAAVENGAVKVLFVDANHNLWQFSKATPDAYWYGSGVPLDTSVREVAAAVNADGRFEYFAIKTDSTLWRRAQSAAGVWDASPTQLDTGDLHVAAINESDGRIRLLIVGTDYVAWEMTQTSPGSATWSATRSLNTPAVEVTAGRNRDGQLTLVGIDPSQRLWAQTQVTRGGAWGAMSIIGTSATGVALGASFDLRLAAAVVRTTDGAIGYTSQITPGGGWLAPTYYSAGAPVRSLALAQNSDGRTEIFYAVGDSSWRHLWKKTVSAAGFVMGSTSTPGVVPVSPAVLQNMNGYLELYFADASGLRLKSATQLTASASGGTWTPVFGLR